MKRNGLRRNCRILEKIGDILGSDILTASEPVAAAELQVHWQDLGPESEMIVVVFRGDQDVVLIDSDSNYGYGNGIFSKLGKEPGIGEHDDKCEG